MTDGNALAVVTGPGDAALTAGVQAGRRDGRRAPGDHAGFGRRAGKRAYVDLVLWLRHPWPYQIVEPSYQVRHPRGDTGHRQADEPAGDRFGLDLPRPFRDISVAHLIEDHPERLHDARHVWLADEDRRGAIEVLDVIGVVPLIDGGVRRGGGMAIKDQLSLRPHTAIDRHVYLPYSGIGLDGMLTR